MPVNAIRIQGLQGIPEILPGTNLVETILTSFALLTRDALVSATEQLIFVVAQKVVSKAEGRLARLDAVAPSIQAKLWASEHNKDPRFIEVVLQESRRVVKMDRGIMIVETTHGFVCANAGVDASNAPAGTVVLLPLDPDESARRLHHGLERGLNRRIAVIISDTFGRPWRMGLTNVALGISGLSPFIDYRGQVDSFGRPLQATLLAVADELAGAAELVMGKTSGIPVAVIEGVRYLPTDGTGKELLRPAEEDLFR